MSPLGVAAWGRQKERDGVEALRRRAIEDVDGAHERLPPEFHRH